MGSGEASRCRLGRLPVARQQIPETRPANLCAVALQCISCRALTRPLAGLLRRSLYCAGLDFTSPPN